MYSKSTPAYNLATAFAFMHHYNNRRILSVTYFVQRPSHQRQLIVENPCQLDQPYINSLSAI